VKDNTVGFEEILAKSTNNSSEVDESQNSSAQAVNKATIRRPSLI
jgi:hypothetical protein